MMAVPAQTLNDFDLRNSAIPVRDIHRGGPPRDGIPSIDTPKFVSPENAGFLRPNDEVISVTVGETTRAYPLRILIWHEIVNDRIGDRHFMVTVRLAGFLPEHACLGRMISGIKGAKQSRRDRGMGKKGEQNLRQHLKLSPGNEHFEADPGLSGTSCNFPRIVGGCCGG